MEPSNQARKRATVDDSDSRQRILAVALELMSERGYAGTSISMITRKTGLPASSTYWHFGSKEALLGSVIEYSADQWLATLPRWEALEGTPKERLGKLLDGVEAGLTSQPFIRVLMLIALEQGGSGVSLDTIRTVREHAAGGFRKAFAEIAPAPRSKKTRAFEADLAMFALAVTDGIFLASQIDPSTDVRRMFRFLRTAFLAAATEFTGGTPA